MQKIALAAAMTIMLSASAFAQTAEEQNLCMNDAFRVCSHTIPDRGRTVACMVEKKAQLSRPCQEVMDRYAQPTTATAYATPAPAPVAAAPVRTMKNASMKPVRTVTAQRPGKPLNILMR
jgi:hypothetical protein